MLSRRSVLAASLLATPLAALAASPAWAEEADADPKALATSGSDLPEQSLGNADAPVTMIEYASMTCPHCARFNANTMPTIRSKYIDTGKVRYVLREYPLDPRATAGFMLARCAGGDRYFPMIDVLFQQQQAWAFVDAPQVLPGLEQIARQAGLSQAQFETCLKDEALFKGIMAVKQRGTDLFKIEGTPAFFFNGKRASGELSTEEVEKILDPMLKG